MRACRNFGLAKGWRCLGNLLGARSFYLPLTVSAEIGMLQDSGWVVPRIENR